MTHKENVLKHYGLSEGSYSKQELAKITKVPLKIIKEVYNRGIGAYKTNPESVRLSGSYVKNVNAPLKYKLSKEQWAMARVYSFLDGNPKHDDDLRANICKKCGLLK
jgi:predicted transcriptional regulator